MATKTLEARFEHLSVNDENEPSGKGLSKPKVFIFLTCRQLVTTNLTGHRALFQRQCLYRVLGLQRSSQLQIGIIC